MENSHGHVSHGQTADSHDSGHGFDTKAIWRTFWILLVITCIELIVGMFIAPRFPHTTKVWFNILYIIFTGAKAFYIIAEFMHLRHEIKNMIMTIAIPALLFIWFIGAFLWDGDSFKNLRNTLDPHHKEATQKPVAPAPAHGTEEHLK
ncbi:MAG: cytochrome C oxidase subunit IV family protein [Chitinophagaceae bacterium]|nr:cytochrome C oxidase subunit IV family protein [Chitinophagaceae bacterium]